MKNKKSTAIIIVLATLLVCALQAFGQEKRGLTVLVKDRQGESRELEIYERMFALVIGIDHYRNVGGLRNAVSDARGVKRVIEEQYAFDRIEELYDEQATKDRILAAFSDMAARYSISENDALFVFMAGHGINFGDVGFIVPYDGSFSEGEYFKNISMLELKDVIGQLVKAKHIFYVLDACYSGGILTRGSSSDYTSEDEYAYLKEVTKEQVRFALTAGDKGQQVLDGGPKGHSVFTGRFIEAFEEAEGYITSSAVSEQIARRVFSDARDRGHVQTPQYGRLLGMGNFVLLKKEASRLLQVQEELAAIEKEMAELQKKVAAARGRAEKDAAEVELRKKAALAEKKRLEEEQLAELAARREAEKNRQAEIARELEANQAKAQADLERLVTAAEARRRLLEEAARCEQSFEQIVKRIEETEKALNDIISSYEKARSDALARVDAYYRGKYAQIDAMKRDPWEKQREFEQRRRTELETFRRNEYDERREINRKYDGEIDKNAQQLTAGLKKLKESEIVLSGRRVSVAFGEFDAERELFPVTVSFTMGWEQMRQELELPVKAASARERRAGYEKVVNTARAGGYSAEIRMGLYHSDFVGYVPAVKSVRLLDLTEQGREVLSVFLPPLTAAALIAREAGNLPKSHAEMGEAELASYEAVLEELAKWAGQSGASISSLERRRQRAAARRAHLEEDKRRREAEDKRRREREAKLRELRRAGKPEKKPEPVEEWVIIDHKTMDFGGNVPRWVTKTSLQLQRDDIFKNYYVFIEEHRDKDLNGVKIWATDFSVNSAISRMVTSRVESKFAGVAAEDKDMLETYLEQVVKSFSEAIFSNAVRYRRGR